MNESLLHYARSLRLDPYPTPDYQVCRSISDISSFLRSNGTFSKPIVTLDTEQTPDNHNYCYTFSLTPGVSRLIYEHDTSTRDFFLSWLDDGPDLIVFHNYLHDNKYLPLSNAPSPTPWLWPTNYAWAAAAMMMTKAVPVVDH